MHFGLHGNLFGCITFKGCLVGGPPWFGELERCPHWFWYRISNSLFICLHAFHVYHLQHVLLFVDYYDNAMFIRSLTCMYSILRHSCLIWTIILCSHHLFSYHVYHRFNNMWIFLIIMFMFLHDDLFPVLMRHDLSICLNVSFH